MAMDEGGTGHIRTYVDEGTLATWMREHWPHG